MESSREAGKTLILFEDHLLTIRAEQRWPEEDRTLFFVGGPFGFHENYLALNSTQRWNLQTEHTTVPPWCWSRPVDVPECMLPPPVYLNQEAIVLAILPL